VGTITPKIEPKAENEKSPHKKKKDLKVQSLTIGNTTITPVSTITIDTNEDGSERDEAEGDDEEMESDSDDDVSFITLYGNFLIRPPFLILFVFFRMTLNQKQVLHRLIKQTVQPHSTKR
jgi:hypothetical protein